MSAARTERLELAAPGSYLPGGFDGGVTMIVAPPAPGLTAGFVSPVEKVITRTFSRTPAPGLSVESVDSAEIIICRAGPTAPGVPAGSTG